MNEQFEKWWKSTFEYETWHDYLHMQSAHDGFEAGYREALAQAARTVGYIADSEAPGETAIEIARVEVLRYAEEQLRALAVVESTSRGYER